MIISFILVTKIALNVQINFTVIAICLYDENVCGIRNANIIRVLRYRYTTYRISVR